jgi:hypothetical protein
MEYELKDKYANFTRELIQCYLKLCPTCKKKSTTVKKGIVTKPIVVTEMNQQAQMDLIDLQNQPETNLNSF